MNPPGAGSDLPAGFCPVPQELSFSEGRAYVLAGAFLLGQDAIPFDNEGRMILLEQMRLRKLLKDGREGVNGLAIEVLKRGAARLRKCREVQPIANAVKIGVGARNYCLYHFLVDSLPLLAGLEWAERECLSDKPALILNARVPEHVIAAFKRLGFGNYPHFTPRPGAALRIERLVISQTGSNGYHRSPGSVRWARRFVLERLRPEPIAPRKLLILRKPENGRNFSNESGLRAALEKRGFEAVYPEDYSFDRQVELFAAARAIVAAHGAALANLLFCPPGAVVIEVFGNLTSNCYSCVSSILGLRYRSVVAPGENSPSGSGDGAPIYADPARIIELLGDEGNFAGR